MKRFFEYYQGLDINGKGNVIFAFIAFNFISFMFERIPVMITFQTTIILSLVCAVVSWICLFIFIKPIRFLERTALSIFLFGPFIIHSLIWINFLTAFSTLSHETYSITDLTIHRRTGKGASFVVVNLKDDVFEDYEGPRTFDYYTFSYKYESVTYLSGRGILGIKIVINRTLNFPKNSTNTSQ